MATVEDDVEWMNNTIIPGIKDGLKASGRTDEPPIILRAHDTDGPLVLSKALPLYKNIYTMSKYTGESLTTYQPGGPWGETHQKLAAQIIRPQLGSSPKKAVLTRGELAIAMPTSFP